MTNLNQNSETNNPEKRQHSFSLTYAKKEVNEAEKNLQLANKLWN